MLNHPDTERPIPSSGKLILPDLSEEEQRVASNQHRTPFDPTLLIRQKTPPPPKKMLPKLAWYWRKDPAYKVFMIALVMVVVASGLFIALISASMNGRSPSGASYSQNPPAKVVPTGKVDLHPAFPTPEGGNGTQQSSQPPAQSTPSLGSTATTQPTMQPGGQLTLQITGYPAAVNNNSRVDITVSTNQPGISVYLQIRYNVQPSRGFAGPGTTDANGNVTIPWTVLVFSFGHKNVQATLTAVGTDQNGQHVNSAPVVIQVVAGPGMG
ncbi:MAG TPA: hypothetical protein VFQ36_17980 [Ktedonobacteraceae bacterium]|nr:hypothetical protein [Ktedonobacteraceae bacterium]